VVPEPWDEDEEEESADGDNLWEQAEEQSDLDGESSERPLEDDEQEPAAEYDEEDQRETA
jgi:hypothetical protein